MAKKIVWKTVKRKVSDLIPYEKNPRKINEKQMKDLKRSLRKYNLAELPAINLDGVVIAGHQRIKALHLLGRGDEEIEVRIPNRQLTEAEFKDYLIVSNKSGGSWDFQGLAENFDIDALSLAGFEDDELGDIFADSLHVEDSKTSDEEEAKKIKKTNIKRGDLFALGKHRLLCGDALDPKTVKKLMGDARADLVNDHEEREVSHEAERPLYVLVRRAICLAVPNSLQGTRNRQQASAHMVEK